MKAISCGILVFFEDKILLGHVTNNHGKYSWNIPKGRLEENESYLECAIRETYEESNLIFKEEDLIDLGLFEYIPKKDLYLYATKIVDEYLLSYIVCNSYVKDEFGNNIFPEFDRLLFWNICDLGQCLSKNIYNTVKKAMEVYHAKVS